MILNIFLIINFKILLFTTNSLRPNDYCQMISSSYSCPKRYSFECIDYTCTQNKKMCIQFIMQKYPLNPSLLDFFEKKKHQQFKKKINPCQIIKIKQLKSNASIFENKNYLNVLLYCLLHLNIILINL
jgi:hypothetical protein